MIITSEDNCIKVDGGCIPFNTFRTEIYNNTVWIISIYDSFRINIPLADTTIDGNTVSSVDELNDFLMTKGFIKGGRDGEWVTMNEVDDKYANVNIVSNTGLTFDRKGYYSYTGDNDITSVLPDPATHSAKYYIIFNTIGTGKLTITGIIFVSGVMVNTFDIMPGEVYTAFSNGLHWAL